MTNHRFWELVGQVLREARDADGLSWADIEKDGGPVAPTLRDNEKGEVRTIDALNRHCEALRLSVLGVVGQVVAKADAREPITSQLQDVIDCYNDGTPEVKLAFRTLAGAVRSAKGSAALRATQKAVGRGRAQSPAARRA